VFGEFKRQLWVEKPTIEMNRPLAAKSRILPILRPRSERRQTPILLKNTFLIVG
jgi:hypothetical protein